MTWHCYGFYDALDGLLYVGMSSRAPHIRLIENLRDQPWREEYHAHRVLRSGIATEALALTFEAAFIRKLQPRFNIKGNEGNPNRVSPYTMRFVDGPFRGQPYRPDLYPQPFAWTPPHAGPYIPRQRRARAPGDATTREIRARRARRAYDGKVYRASRWPRPGAARVGPRVMVAACVTVWVLGGVLIAAIWPATPAIGPIGRHVAGLTAMGIGMTAVPHAWWRRWLMLAGVLVTGVSAFFLTKGL
jgi:hypothetical protein